jgi:hypothetical protein
VSSLTRPKPKRRPPPLNSVVGSLNRSPRCQSFLARLPRLESRAATTARSASTPLVFPHPRCKGMPHRHTALYRSESLPLLLSPTPRRCGRRRRRRASPKRKESINACKGQNKVARLCPLTAAYCTQELGGHGVAITLAHRKSKPRRQHGALARASDVLGRAAVPAGRASSYFPDPEELALKPARHLPVALCTDARQCSRRTEACLVVRQSWGGEGSIGLDDHLEGRTMGMARSQDG